MKNANQARPTNSAALVKKQSKIQRSPGRKIKYAYGITFEGDWLTIGLTVGAGQALSDIRRVLCKKPYTCSVGEVDFALLSAAIAHFEVLKPLFFADVRYAEVEGFAHVGQLWERAFIIRQAAKAAKGVVR